MGHAIRELTSDEVTEFVLPLRLLIWHEQLKMIRPGVTDPEALRDDYEADANHFGAFAGGELAGAIRLIVRENAALLPSGKYIPAGVVFDGRAGEFSKGQVRQEFEGRGLFTALVAAAYERARERGVRHLLISTIDEPKVFWKYGFVQVGAPFEFDDGRLQPDRNALLYHATVEPA